MPQCPACQGSGKCSECGGTGVVQDTEDDLRCSSCDGSGACPNCYGSGQAGDDDGVFYAQELVARGGALWRISTGDAGTSPTIGSAGSAAGEWR
jgi:hypothetical protein